MATSTEKAYRIQGLEVIEGPGTLMVEWHKATPGDILMKGDLLQYAEGGVQLYVIGSDDNLSFAGVCMTDSPGTDIEADQTVLVMVRGMLRVQMDATGVPRPGVTLKLTSATGPTIAQRNAGTRVAYTFTAATAAQQAEGLMWAMQEAGASATCRAYVDVFALRAANYNSGAVVFYGAAN